MRKGKVPTTSRTDGALARPFAVTLFVAGPELPSEVQAVKYFSRHNFNQYLFCYPSIFELLLICVK